MPNKPARKQPAPKKMSDDYLSRVDLFLDNLEKEMAKIGHSKDISGIQTSSVEVNRILEELEFLGVEGVDIPGSLKLSISNDLMQAVLSVTPPAGDGLPVQMEAVRHELESHGVLQFDKEAVKLIIQNGAFHEAYGIIATGEKPIQGIPAKYELAPKFEKPSGLTEAGRIDYKVLESKTCVTAEDLLLKFIPAVPSMPGYNVVGRKLHPEEIQQPPLVKPGPGTRLIGKDIYALITGDLIVRENMVCVVPTKTVAGDVDMSVGHIDFDGSVKISGSISEGFIVKCTGDLLVGGTIGNATVEAGGSISVSGGIIGEKCSVIGIGPVSAKFIEQAHVSSRESITMSEAMQAHLCADNFIDCTAFRGAIYGGCVRVGQELRCKTLGSPTGTNTIVFFGEDCQTREQNKHIQKMLVALKQKKSQLQTMGRESLSSQILRIDQACAELLRQQAVLLSKERVYHHPKVLVADKVFPGVTICHKALLKQIQVVHQHSEFVLHLNQIQVQAFRG